MIINWYDTLKLHPNPGLLVIGLEWVDDPGYPEPFFLPVFVARDEEGVWCTFERGVRARRVVDVRMWTWIEGATYVQHPLTDEFVPVVTGSILLKLPEDAGPTGDCDA